MTAETELQNLFISFLRLCLLLRPLAVLSPWQKIEIENRLVDATFNNQQIPEYEVDNRLREFLHKVLASADVLNQQTIQDVEQLQRLLSLIKETMHETHAIDSLPGGMAG